MKFTSISELDVKDFVLETELAQFVEEKRIREAVRSKTNGLDAVFESERSMDLDFLVLAQSSRGLTV